VGLKAHPRGRDFWRRMGMVPAQKEAPKAGSGRGRNLAGPRLLPGIGLGDRGASDLLSGAAVCSLKSQAVLFEERISWQ